MTAVILDYREMGYRARFRRLFFQIFQNFGMIGDNHSNNLTFFQVWTVAARRRVFVQRALTYLTKTIAKHSFHSFNAAALTVDMFRQNGSII